MWLFNGEEITGLEQVPDNSIGFVYKITDLVTGKIYIGKKIFFSNRKKKLTKKEIAELPVSKGRKPTSKRVIAETDWKDYFGSSKTLLAELKTRSKLEFRREIIIFCYNKKQLTYWELHHQCVNEVIIYPDKSYNDTILGKFFHKDLETSIK